MTTAIRPKERDAVVQSLRAGVVPRLGQHLIQVGRLNELKAMIIDLKRIAEGGSSFRIVIGEYGAGKTFFLNLVRAVAMQEKLVTMHADFNPDRRLHATGGQARSLYAELTKNMATRNKMDGGALTNVVEKFISQAIKESKQNGQEVDAIIRSQLANLTEMVNGYDFAEVISAYYRGYEEGNEVLKTDAIRWLRGEFSTKTDARKALGVRNIIDDASVYDQIKLLARFVRLAGYAGLVVCMDELVNVYKLANTQARNGNYEQILRILNDSLQGSAEGLGIILGGTPEFLLDTSRGLYSYSALQSRLAENTFAKAGLMDYSAPVLRLATLNQDEFYALLQKLRNVYAYNEPSKYLIPDEAIPVFMEHCAKRIGEAYFRTPRTTITSFINLLAILEQNPGVNWKELIGGIEVQHDKGGELDKVMETDDEFATFRI